MKLSIKFFLLLSLMVCASATAFSPAIVKHFNQNGDLLAKLNDIVMHSQGLDDRLDEASDSLLIADNSLIKASKIIKQMKEVNGNALAIYNEIMFEALAYGKIDFRSDAFDPHHVLADDLLEIASLQASIIKGLVRASQSFSTLAVKWIEAGFTISELGHFAELCDTEAAHIARRHAAWMNQSEIALHLDECRSELAKFKSIVDAQGSHNKDAKLEKMKRTQEEINLAVERIEMQRRAPMGLNPPLVIPHADLVVMAFTLEGEIEIRILRSLLSPDFLNHRPVLEEHLKSLRDANATEDDIRGFELDLFRTQQIEDLMMLNAHLGNAMDLGRLTVTNLGLFGFFSAAYESAKVFLDYARTKLGTAAAELRKPAKISRPPSPKKRLKDPADIDFGIPKRLTGFGGEDSQISLDLATSNEVEPDLQKVREYELQQMELLKQEELRGRELAKQRQEREAQERSEVEQDKLACWARAGHPWAKGGKQDLSFYYAIKSYLEEGRLNGQARETIVETKWKEFKEKQNSAARQKSHLSIKTVSKKAVQPKAIAESASQPAPAVRRNPWDNDNNAPATRTNNEIDWSKPVEANETQKQNRRKSGESPKRQNNTLERAALNEYLFIESALTWHDNIEKRDPIQDQILEDVLWYSSVVLTNAIAENYALRRTAHRFGDEPMQELSVFTANDSDARAIRAHIVHGFRGSQELERFVREVVIPYLGPRIKRFCDGESVTDTLLVDLSRNELFEKHDLVLDINSTIRKQFERLARYVAYLMAKEQRMAHAFALLNQQNEGHAVFELGRMDYRLVDVFAARAIEGVLVRLGELHHLYITQAPENQTLPAQVAAFLWELNQKVRKKAAHEFDENHAEWHFSPLSAEVIHRFMLTAVKILPFLNN